MEDQDEKDIEFLNEQRKKKGFRVGACPPVGILANTKQKKTAMIL